jgi:hypothetical protein
VKVEGLEENQEHQDLTFLSGETGFEKSAMLAGSFGATA